MLPLSQPQLLLLPLPLPLPLPLLLPCRSCCRC
jgi:hypothetical protein